MNCNVLWKLNLGVDLCLTTQANLKLSNKVPPKVVTMTISPFNRKVPCYSERKLFLAANNIFLQSAVLASLISIESLGQ